MVKELWRWHINWVFQSKLMQFEDFRGYKFSGGPFLGRKISLGFFWGSGCRFTKGVSFSLEGK